MKALLEVVGQITREFKEAEAAQGPFRDGFPNPLAGGALQENGVTVRISLLRRLVELEAREHLELSADHLRLKALNKALGYVQNGSDSRVTICQDDATHEYIIRGPRLKVPGSSSDWVHGASLGDALDGLQDRMAQVKD